MREIKFRAWDKESRTMCMVEDVGFTFLGKDINSIVCRIEGRRQPIGDNFELMQYTGLKDCNGEEIFEGDILDNGARIGVVYFDDKKGQFRVRYGEGFTGEIASSNSAVLSQVIGNKYENPELE